MADRDAEVAHFAGFHLLVEHFPQAGRLERLVATGVELIQIDVVSLERLERGIELPADIVGVVVDGAVQVAIEVVPELGAMIHLSRSRFTAAPTSRSET